MAPPTCYAGGMLTSKQFTSTSHQISLINLYYYYRAWKKHLRSPSKENQLSMYQTLCLLESEVDINQFRTQLSLFTTYWESKEPKFMEYFIEYYQDRAGMTSTILVHTCTGVCVAYIAVHHCRHDAIVILIMVTQTQICFLRVIYYITIMIVIYMHRFTILFQLMHAHLSC